MSARPEMQEFSVGKAAGWLLGSLASIFFALSVGIVAVAAWRQAQARGVTIDPIDVPASLAEAGQDRRSMAGALEAQIRALQKAGSSERLERPFYAKPLDLDVPKTTITARFAIEPILSLAGLSIAHVSGALSKASGSSPERFQLDLSDASERPDRFFSESGALESLLQRAALAVLSRYDAYAATAALIATDQKGAPLELLAKFRAEAAASQHGEDLPWAELLDGYDFQARKAWGLAADRFRAAGERYARLYPGRQSWHLAMDGEAYAFMQDGQDGPAAELLDRLLDAQPNVVSALYHRGILAQRAGQSCAALKFFERSTAADPRYSLAWEGMGTLYTEHFNALRNRPEKDGAVLDCMPGDQMAVLAKARELLLNAIGGNELSGPAWYQLGVLNYLSGSFAEAARYFKRATDLNADDAHSWHSLGDSLLAQADLVDAARAYCRARTLRPDQRWHDDQLAKAARIAGAAEAGSCQ